MALDMHRKNVLNKGQNREEVKDADILKRIMTVEYPRDPLELLGERNFNEPREVPKEEIGTPVQEFFRDTTVFITGGTGFMGKILTEKLLRVCPHIKRIYLLVRSKKGKTSNERIEEIFQDRVRIYLLLFSWSIYLPQLTELYVFHIFSTAFQKTQVRSS